MNQTFPCEWNKFSYENFSIRTRSEAEPNVNAEIAVSTFAFALFADFMVLL